MRTIFLVLSAAVLSLSTPCVGAPPIPAHVATPDDGYITPDEVCGGGKDLADQQYVSRPYGDVIHVPAGLPLRQLQAIEGAARLRRENSQGKAFWRVVVGALGPEGLPVEQQGVLFAACVGTPTYQGGSWGYRVPAGGLGLATDRGYVDPGPTAVRLAQTLKDLEGEGD